MRLDGLIGPFKNSSEYLQIKKNIDEGVFPMSLWGLSDSGKSYIISALYENTDKTIFVVAPSDVEAKNLYEDLNFFLPYVYYLPTKEVVFYDVYAISGDLKWERLKIFNEICKKDKKIIVLSAESLCASYVPFNLYKKYTFSLKIGDTIDLDVLNRNLIKSGYERCEVVEAKGQFSIKGGILDIFPPISVYPYRIELFGDDIDSIRQFNLETQRSIEKVKEISIFPASEIIIEEEHRNRAYDLLSNDLENLIKTHNKEAIKGNNIKDKINLNMESLKEKWDFESIESYLPYFYEKTQSFFDIIGDALVFVDDISRTMGKIDSVYFEFNDNYESLLSGGSILPKQGELLLSKDEVIERIKSCNIINLTSIQKENNFLKGKQININQYTTQNYHGQLQYLIEDIKDKKNKNYKIVILSGTRVRGERLVKTLLDNEISSTYKDDVSEVLSSQVVITFGSLLKGYEFPDLKLSIISDKEVFGESKRKLQGASKTKKGIGKIKSFTELKKGDYVVHTNHGIGVYDGIKHLEVEGIKKDYLQISYQGDDKLFVPVEQLDLIQKYIGSEGNAPKVNKLGGSEWVKAKNKVKKSIVEMADELLKLYAVRSTMKGYRYSEDTPWQKQFEDEFPFQETEDQLTSIGDIKKDMESVKSMDRLLCGDVGYGKTEVAVRAAFKAVMDGKQVAFLVPTTILAEQHYNNFIKRFSDFPVKIDMISRFRSAAEQKVTIKALKEGNVDILIGTHRILQKDLQFKDLGLLVVDEEQRFGVTHKEKIKALKKNVDVLTLSATPIPRTLHMSLLGVRDISVIETPPEERYPVQTYVVEYNDQLIHDAILREINRGGQVYFVYNRVQSIQEIAVYLSKLIPEAKVAVAHGQMTERELEKVMIGFMENKFNVLLCTTIIETGIDIQNVNTMIIYDSDKMGLSQLYQLRGRVGRSNRIAYAYLTYKKDKVLTEVAEKRLKAIKDFTELGSGFKIALKDLEIRGAGNIMGSAQHGHMAAVGYDLYCRMLEETVKLMTGEIKEEAVETSCDIKVDGYIPSSYITDETQKIEVYKKIASISSLEDVLDIRDELIDRFSDIVKPVDNLIEIAYLRSVAKTVGIVDITDRGNQISLTFNDKDRISENMVKAVISKYNKNLVFRIGEKPVITVKSTNMKKEDILGALKEIVVFLRDMQ